MDRVQTQEEISLLIANVFADKKRLNYEEYVQINQEISDRIAADTTEASAATAPAATRPRVGL